MKDTKRQKIEKLLSEGKSPEEIAEEVGCTVRYAYEIKALKEQPMPAEPIRKKQLAEIENTLKKLSGDINLIRKEEKDPIIICPCCGNITDLLSGEICDKCGVLVCFDCIESHKQPNIAGESGEQSFCKKFQDKSAELEAEVNSEEKGPEKKSIFQEFDEWLDSPEL